MYTVDSRYCGHPLGGEGGGQISCPLDRESVIAWYVRKKLFSLETYEIICNYAKRKFLTLPYEPEKDLAAIKQEIFMLAPN